MIGPIVGWVLLCIVSGAFGIGTLAMLWMSLMFQAREGLIMAVVFGLLSWVFGLCAYSAAPFSVALKVMS